MSALASPWVDCGRALSYRLEGNMQIRIKNSRQMQLNQGLFVVSTIAGLASLRCRAFAFPPLGESQSPLVFLESAPQEAAGVPGPLSQVYTYIETGGPFRLGAALGSDTDALNRERYAYTYALFPDENTVYNYTLGPATWTRGHPSAFWLVSFSRLSFNLSAISQIDITNVAEFLWNNISNDTILLDTTGLNDGTIQGTGPGAVQVTNNLAFYGGGSTGQRAVAFGAPYTFRLDVDVTDWQGNPLNTAFTAVNVVGERTTPHLADYSFPINSWNSTIPPDGFFRGVQMDLTNAWMASKGWPANTLSTIPIHGNPPLQDPSAPGGTYQPLTLRIAGSVPVLLSTNAWTPDDSRVTVAGNVFTVSGAGASVTRNLKANWKAWTGLDTGGKTNPEFGIDRYTITKHDYLSAGANAGQDVWSWATYGWAKLDIDCPAAGTLVLTVAGQHLSVTDSHQTNAGSRQTQFTSGMAPFLVTYNVPVTSGANSVFIDLLFPLEGGPFYYGRVEGIRLAGLAVGTYTLNGFSLVAREDAYLKADWNQDFTGLHISQDGAGVMLNLPDTFHKLDETGDFGGAVLLQTPAFSNVLVHQEKTLAQIADELNRIEGITATIDATASNAAMQDADGNHMRETALFIPPLVPHVRVKADTDYKPPCFVRHGKLNFPNIAGPLGLPVFCVYARHKIGGGVEAQAVTPSARRAPAGAVVRAVRADNNQTMATGTTDASGYVALSFLPDEQHIYELVSP